MAWSTADLSALQDAIKTGAKTVRFADRTVEYRSMEEMLTAYNTISNYLAAQNSTTRQIRVFGQQGW